MLEHICGVSVYEERGVILAMDVNKDEPVFEYKLNKY